MKKIALVMIAMLVFTGSLLAQPITLKYATFEPPQAFAMKSVWYPWVEMMNAAGKGAFKIEVFTGGTLNRVPPKQMKVMRDGVADIAFIIPSYTPNIFEDNGVVQIPMVAGYNAVPSSRAIFNMYKKGLLGGYDSFVPLMLATGQQYAIHTTFPVKVPGDMKGKKLRATGEMQHLIIQELGAAPVGMPVTKVAESMSRGLIQGTFQEWNGMRTFKIQDVATYHCMVPMGTVTFLLGMNKASFNKLPKDAQNLFLNNQEYSKLLWSSELDTSLNIHHKKVEADPKHKVHYPTKSELAQWKTVLDRAVQKWLNKKPKRKALLDAYKKELAMLN